MKVVLFCGGLGMRMREYSEAVPKPLVPIGDRPIIWHVMKYYAHYGHRDFILCLGYKAAAIKQYFLTYNECVSNDFVYSNGGRTLELLASDIQDWNITFVDTGLHSNIGQRLSAVRKHLNGEEMFLANYTDGLSDLPLPEIIEDLRRRQAVAEFVSVRPNASFHLVRADAANVVTSICHLADSGHRINGGFFVFDTSIFEYLQNGEELVKEPFQRLVAARRLISYPYDGFWACMDTVKEVAQLEQLYAEGRAPWEVWKTESQALGAHS
jgi:glucose-1-phosphate cytidylyltransferase